MAISPVGAQDPAMSETDPPAAGRPDDAGTQPPPPPTPPPPPPWAERPLFRRDEGKHLAGVAGGLADYLGVGTGPMRLAFVILAFLGVGVPLYVVGWVAMPSPAQPQSYVERWFGRSPNPAALVAVAGVLIVLFAVNDDPGADGLGWGLALLFGGWLLFRADSRAGAAVPGAAVGAAGPATGPAATGTWYGPGGTAPPPPVWQPAPPRPRSMLGRLTIGVALAAAGAAALLDQTGALALSASQYLALVLAVVGLGLVIGTWVGRARGLIFVGLLLVPTMLIASVHPAPMRSGVGGARFSPETIDEVEPVYEMGAGQLVLDLTQVDWSGRPRTVTTTVGIGETRIILPAGLTVSVDVDIANGEVNLFGERYVGRPFTDAVRDTVEGTADGGRLDLHVEHAIGKVTITQAREF